MAGLQPAAIHLQRRQQAIAGRRVRLLVNAGALLVSAGGSVVIIHAATPSDDAAGGPACSLVAFSVFLLGVSLVTLALAADRFPRAARVGAAVATATNRYLFGLGW
ncbi:hypothetical protein PAHAL_4G046700 [Panicum hallii]|jgi:hypothetical protein|uniref:Uncharacterized protein n=1 Tax=Panicum hallii TaxID=206008 RepID=A0A2S3HH61_9POAL|nr:uncharacterized protein LOC112891075 [Panicum hallii]PAN22819.1 hypothetical protein PAHAL_4G046700 [Panicum hallii]